MTDQGKDKEAGERSRSLLVALEIEQLRVG